MKTKQSTFHRWPVIMIGLLVSCWSDDQTEDTGLRRRITIRPGDGAEAAAQQAFITADSGTDIYFKEGVYAFTSPLSIDNKQDIQVLGEGRDKTVFDFNGQGSSGEGLLATNCTKLLFQDFTVRNAKGDALKAKSCNQVTFRRLATIWTGEPRKENGAYGIYPVQCTDVMIDSCYAYGASDSGIYVGQSTNAVIRNSTAEGNVAGIEIENTINADIYDNKVFDNAGGILVFDLPNLTQYGKKSRVFNNLCYENNRNNFAPVGNTVSNVPAGTGIMLMSTREVEVFGNEISNNMFAGIIMASHLMIGKHNDPNYDPLYSDVYLHDNSYRMEFGSYSAVQSGIGAGIAALLKAYGYSQPDIMIDNLKSGSICISEAEGTTFVNLHAESFDPEKGVANFDDDHSPFKCNGARLTAVDFQAYGQN